MSDVCRKSTDNQASQNKNNFRKLASTFHTDQETYL